MVKHRLLNCATALSLILCIAALCLWPASYFSDSLHYNRDFRRLHGTSIGVYHIRNGRLRLYIVYPLPSAITPVDMPHGASTWQPTGAPDVPVPPDTPPGVWPFPDNVLPCRGGGSVSQPFWGIDIEAETLLTSGGKIAVPFTTNLFLSLWLLALITAVLPATRAASHVMQRVRQKGRRALAGHCRICGYDLRATPDRCPECGAVPLGEPNAPHNQPLERTGPAV